MAIYRGIGGAGDSNTDATVTAVTEQATNAQTSANNAATSATNAASSASAASSSATQAATSATASANSATASSSSATNAANSATAAANSATEAGVSATNAASSEASVAANATAAATSETNAATSATNAATSETNAATSASTATTKASEASASATSASTSASTATTKASEASTSATNAATSETNAATSASNAATSATNAATSETNAASSASTASTQATAASASAATASTQAANAATSATNSANSATASATSASNAATSETNAANSATAAAGSATSAASSASSASTSASTATAAKDAALAALDSFDDRYLGTKTSDPTVDNDGNALIAGALYFNTTDDTMKVYEGSQWVAAYASLSGAVLETGGTMSGNLAFGDNNKAIFGAGSDLQIYHDGSHSYIDDLGTGDLQIRANNLALRNTAGEPYIRCNSDEWVKLYYNDAEKLATTSTGIDVTGTATMDGLTVDGTIELSEGNALRSSGELVVRRSSNQVRLGSGNVSDTVNVYAGAQKRITADTSGDISFYEDTGTTAKFFWDASAESLGIGTTSLYTALHATTGTTGQQAAFGGGDQENWIGIAGERAKLGYKNSLTTLQAYTGDAIQFCVNNATFQSGEAMRITSSGNVGIGTSSPESGYVLDARGWGSFQHPTGDGVVKIQTGNNTGTSLLYFSDSDSVFSGSISYSHSNDAMLFNTTASERMRLDANGNLLVGTTSATLFDDSTGTGLCYRTGQSLDVKSDAATTMVLNRVTSDGEIISLRKDGTSVGSIGVGDGDNLYISGSAGSTKGLYFNDDTIGPAANGYNISDATTNLGAVTARFKDLYLSGTANAARGIGGTHTSTILSSGTPNMSTYQNFVWTLTGNITLVNPTTESVGQTGFFVFKQDATGGRTVSLGSEYKTAGGAGLTLSSAANAIDVVPYIVSASGQILLGAPQLAFA